MLTSPSPRLRVLSSDFHCDNNGGEIKSGIEVAALYQIHTRLVGGNILQLFTPYNFVALSF